MNILEIFNNELAKSKVVKLACRGEVEQALNLCKQIKSMRYLPFMSEVPDEGMFASELRALGFRLFAKKQYQAALQFYTRADELIESTSILNSISEEIVDKQFERAKNYSDLANCKMALKDIKGAAEALGQCLSILEQMPKPPHLWQGINRQYQMICSSWKREVSKLQDESLIDRVNMRFNAVEHAILESRSEVRIVDYWYKWPQVPPIALH